MPLKQITELETFAEHIKLAAIHADGERAALQAVPGKIVSSEAGGYRVRLHNLPPYVSAA